MSAPDDGWKQVYDRLVTESTVPAIRAGYDTDATFEERSAIIDRLIASLPGRAGSSCIDVGCNVGHFTSRLIQRGFEVTGLDFSLKALEQARILAPGARYVEGDALALSARDGEYDCVASFGVIQLLPDWRRGVSELWRVLKPGGTGIIETNRKQPIVINLVRQLSYVARGLSSPRTAWKLLTMTSAIGAPGHGPGKALYFTPDEVRSLLGALGAVEIRFFDVDRPRRFRPSFVFGMSFKKPG